MPAYALPLIYRVHIPNNCGEPVRCHNF